MQFLWNEAWIGGSASILAVKLVLQVSGVLYLCPWNNNARNKKAKCMQGCVWSGGKGGDAVTSSDKGPKYLLVFILYFIA